MTLDENNQKLKIKRNSSPEISDSNKKEILINAENIKFKSTGNFSLSNKYIGTQKKKKETLFLKL